MEVGTAFGGVPTPDPLAQFLGRVLAWHGPGEPETYVNIHGFTPKAQVATRRFPRKGGGRSYTSMVEYAQLQQFLFMLDRDGDEAFFCISTRSATKGADKQGNRKATRAKALNRPVRLKAWVLDLDVKPKGYPSQRAALAAVLPFLDGLGLKPGPIVDTGVGLHVYLTTPVGISPEVWQPLANALIEAARQAGLKFDVAVTRDDDRILRIPGSRNLKDPANPKVCRLLSLGIDTPLSDLQRVLAPFMGVTPTSPHRANGHTPHLDLSFLPKRPPITGPEADRARAEVERLRVVTSVDLLLGACPVVADSDWRGGNGDREPLWKEFANLCHYVENGRDFFHDLSSDDPRYDEDQTDQKYDERVLMGWPLCSTIGEAGGDPICRSCPHYGEGKSPLHFATRGDPPGEAYSGQVNGHVNGATLSAAPFTVGSRPIWLPEPYIYTADRYICTPDGRKCFNTPIIDIRPRYDNDGGAHRMSIEFTTLRGTHDHDDTNVFAIPAGVLATRTKSAEAMGQFGLFYNPSVKDFDIMPDVMTQVREMRLAVTRERTGWSKDGTEFAFGGKVYSAQGPRTGATPIDAYLVPQGNLDNWKGAANILLNRGLVELEVIMATGYAGPLVAFTSVDGVFLYAWSGPSGRGKSASSACACSVSCDPHALIKSNTPKGGLKRIVRFNSIPVYFDELVPDNIEEAKQMAQIVKSTTSGSDMVRLRQSGASEQETLQSRNQVVGCGNRRITEVAKAAETNAQAARVVEFEVPDKLSTSGVQPEDMEGIKSAFEHNFGVAMEVYIDYVVRNRLQVHEAVRMTVKALREHLKAGHDARFWLAQMAVIIVGAKIARMLGLQQFDVAGIQKFLVDWYKRSHREVFSDANSDDVEVHIQRLRDFYNDNLRARLVTEHLPQRGRGTQMVLNKDLPMSPDQLAFRIAVKDMRMYTSVKKWRDWCDRQRRGMSFEHSKEVLMRHNACVYHRKNKTIGGGTSYVTASEPVLEFDLRDPRLSGFADEQE